MKTIRSSYLIILLTALTVIVVGCSSTKLDTPLTEGEQLNALYDKAMLLVKDKDFVDAAILFEDIERQYPYSKWASQAQLMGAYCYFKSDFYDESLNSLDRFISLHPANEKISYAFYLRALNHFNQIEDVEKDQSMTEIALKSFYEVINKFPESKFAKESKDKIEIINDRLAAKEMEIARYYQYNHQWISAINRYNLLLDEHKTSIYTAEALHRLVEIYYTIGLLEEAKKYAATLGYNFPESKWYERSFEIINSETNL